MGNTERVVEDFILNAVHPHTHGEHASSILIDTVISVHPHTHGEHTMANINPDEKFGSSPHAWGTHSSSLIHQMNIRFIPTRMGNTNLKAYPNDTGTVHPHTHGEHLLICGNSS